MGMFSNERIIAAAGTRCAVSVMSYLWSVAERMDAFVIILHICGVKHGLVSQPKTGH